jgi:hypothetical protein
MKGDLWPAPHSGGPLIATAPPPSGKPGRGWQLALQHATGGKPRPYLGNLSGLVDDLNIVTVGIDDPGCIIVRVILELRCGLCLDAGTSRDRRIVECINF